MPDQVLSCVEARELIQTGESGPALAAHLATCEACLEALLEDSLRRPPAGVSVPAGFREQVLARLPARAPVEFPDYRWFVLAAGLLVLSVALLWWNGTLPAAMELLARPAVLATAAGIEAALSLAWLWSVVSESA